MKVNANSPTTTHPNLFKKDQFTAKGFLSTSTLARRDALIMVTPESRANAIPQINGRNPDPGLRGLPNPILKDSRITTKEMRNQKTPLI